MTDIHLTARTRWPHQPFLDRENCVALWQRLQNRFPLVHACLLMPNHLHLAMKSPNPLLTWEALHIELRAFTRAQLPGTNLWNEVPKPDLLATPKHLKRTIRYILLNPCRARLASDPLEWEWSTHRDVTGAASPSWVNLSEVSRIFETTPQKLPLSFHEYVSGDPSVEVHGTRLQPLLIAGIQYSPELLLRAILLASRSSNQLTPQIRRLTCLLAAKVSPWPLTIIAKALKISPQRISQILNQPPNSVELKILSAAQKVLCDQRMLGAKNLAPVQEHLRKRKF